MHWKALLSAISDIWKKISLKTIFMTLILLKNEVNHKNFEISVKKMSKIWYFEKKFYFQTAINRSLRYFRYEKNLARDHIHDAHSVEK